jgi:hypothetical protein
VATTEIDIPDYPFFLQANPASTNPIYYSAADFRAYTTAFQRRIGILGGGHFGVTQADNVGFKVKVKAGYANAGGYIVHLPTDTEIPMPWAKPASGSITHKIYIAVYDEYVAGAVNKAKLVAVQGTGGSGSPPPAGAATTLLLATIDVSASSPNIQAKDITNVAQHGGTPGDYFDLSTNPFLMFGYSPAGSTGGTNNPRAIYNNGFVHLSGRLRQSNSNPFPADTEIYFMNLPSQFIPKYNRYLTGVCSANSGAAGQGMTFRLTIPTDGHCTARIPTGYAPVYLTLDGIIYDLD